MTHQFRGILALLLVTLARRPGRRRPARLLRFFCFLAAAFFAFFAFFAFCWLAESMTARGWCGGALLIAGMIVSQWNAAPRPAAALAPE